MRYFSSILTMCLLFRTLLATCRLVFLNCSAAICKGSRQRGQLGWERAPVGSSVGSSWDPGPQTPENGTKSGCEGVAASDPWPPAPENDAFQRQRLEHPPHTPRLSERRQTPRSRPGATRSPSPAWAHHTSIMSVIPQPPSKAGFCFHSSHHRHSGPREPAPSAHGTAWEGFEKLRGKVEHMDASPGRGRQPRAVGARGGGSPGGCGCGRRIGGASGAGDSARG